MFAKFQTGRIGSNHVKAPDGSEIRLFHEMKGGGLSECTLPAGLTSSPISHRNIEEIWFFTHGTGWFGDNKETLKKLSRLNQAYL